MTGITGGVVDRNVYCRHPSRGRAVVAGYASVIRGNHGEGVCVEATEESLVTVGSSCCMAEVTLGDTH